MFQSKKTSLILLCLCQLTSIAVLLLPTTIEAFPLEQPLADSPQHVIKAVNYRNRAVAGESIGKDAIAAQSRQAKASDEDGPLMYLVIKPVAANSAPAKLTVAPKKQKNYRADNQAIYMSGVVNSNNNNDNSHNGPNEQHRKPRLNLASGAYPVFYSIAAANGKFGRNIRALTKEEISLAEKALGL